MSDFKKKKSTSGAAVRLNKVDITLEKKNSLSRNAE